MPVGPIVASRGRRARAARSRRPARPIAVVALGGNALLGPGERPTIETQATNAARAARQVAGLLARYRVVLTHGNGPQVGNIVIRAERARGEAYGLPLDVCVAESEGETGYLLAQALHNAIGLDDQSTPVVSILTRVLVDRRDPAFARPTKPIGPFRDAAFAAAERARGSAWVEDAGRGWRRVVPSPAPLEVLEARVIAELLELGALVIAAGGGGIPVARRGRRLEGVEAVIDKDQASACLAVSLGAELLLILTGEDAAYLDYRTPRQRRAARLDVERARALHAAGHFPEGSMGPKVLAAADFAARTGGRAVITAPGRSRAALRGRAGTTIARGARERGA